jgi:hypothetical protein
MRCKRRVRASFEGRRELSSTERVTEFALDGSPSVPTCSAWRSSNSNTKSASAFYVARILRCPCESCQICDKTFPPS